MKQGPSVNMSTTICFLRALWSGFRQPSVTKRYRDAGIAIAFTGFTQLLLVPLQVALDRASVKLPASILFMFLYAGALIIANSISSRVGVVYNTHIRGATDFLGQHMSFGFVASFLMLNRDHITDGLDIPKIAGSFLVTGLFGYAGTFAIATVTCHAEKRFRGTRRSTPYGAYDADNIGRRGRCTDSEAAKRISKASQTSSVSIPNSCPATNRHISTEDSLSSSPVSKEWTPWVSFILRTSPSWICVGLLLFLGIPLSAATGHEVVYEAAGFLLFWVISVQLQRSLKASSSRGHGNRSAGYAKALSVAVILTNPVMVTTLLGSAYFWIKKLCTGDDIADILTAFRQWSSLSQAIEGSVAEGDHVARGERTLRVGAADLLAGPILDAGIASLGFKMFEHRRALVSALATMLVTTSTMAVAGTFINVAVAHHVFRLSQEEALAFACRSVTIAFGVPVVESLGGTGTLASALCIFNGMAFQMSGDWMLRTLHVQDVSDSRHTEDEPREGQDILLPTRMPSEETNTGLLLPLDAQELPHGPDSRPPCPAPPSSSSPRLVASGVTIGINAAAMGTAHLIERDSAAAAYSALSMTLFGAATVVLTTVIPGVGEVLQRLASSSS